MRTSARACCCGLLLLLAACAAEPPAEELLAALPHAEVLRADAELLFSERVTRQGWGLEERDAEGRFRWALGGEAEILFHSVAESGTTLAGRGRGAFPEGRGAQTVQVLLNDVELGSWELPADWSDVELAVAPAALRRGANRLLLRFAEPLAPAAGSRDRRPLAACFRTLVIGGSRPLPEDRAPLEIELGAEAAGALLGDGWSEPVAAPGEVGWRWAPAPRALMNLELPTPADRRLRLTANRPDALDSQRVELWLNGRQLSEHQLTAEWSTFVAQAPREEWLTGANELLLRFDRLHVAEGASRSARVARLTVETVGEPALAAGQDADGLWVRQPAGTSADLFRLLPGRSPRLRLESGARSAVSVRVAVDVEPDRGSPSELWRGELAPGAPRSVDLSPWAGQLVRLRLSALGAGVVWRRLELAGWPEPDAREPSPPPTGGSDDGKRPNLLLYVIDTLRAENTSLYGYRRPTTPRLEELAAEGILFDPAWANASWTRPGTATLLTGALPSVHGAVNILGRLSPDVELLSETLQAAGYLTWAVVTNPYLRGTWGLDRGWDDYRYIDLAPRFTDSSERLNEEVIPRLAELAAARRPFFLYLHSMDPHSPFVTLPGYDQFLDPDYRGPIDGSMASIGALLEAVRRDGAPAHRADRQRLLDLYDGAILHNDARIGELVDALAGHGLLESTAILVTSDHGEEFFEHGGVAHGHTLYQEQIRVPMLLRPPGGAALRRIAGAQQVDVAVMLAALAGVAGPPTASGRDLPLLGDADRRPVFSEEELRDQRLWSFVENGMKLHYNRNAKHAEWQGRETRELFDLATDEDELHNLWRERPVVAGYLLERARALAARLPSAAGRDSVDPEELSDELQQQLRALGYLQ